MLINCYLIKIEVSAHYALQWFLSFVLSFVVACIFFIHIEKILPSRGFCLLKMKHIKRFQKIFTTSQKKEI